MSVVVSTDFETVTTLAEIGFGAYPATYGSVEEEPNPNFEIVDAVGLGGSRGLQPVASLPVTSKVVAFLTRVDPDHGHTGTVDYQVRNTYYNGASWRWDGALATVLHHQTARAGDQMLGYGEPLLTVGLISPGGDFSTPTRRVFISVAVSPATYANPAAYGIPAGSVQSGDGQHLHWSLLLDPPIQATDWTRFRVTFTTSTMDGTTPHADGRFCVSVNGTEVLAATDITLGAEWGNTLGGVGGTPPPEPRNPSNIWNAVDLTPAGELDQLYISTDYEDCVSSTPPPHAVCAGGGGVVPGANPPLGPYLPTTPVLLPWVEVTIGGIVHRWAAATIPHGAPKMGRILRFGSLTRRLTDGDGGPQAATVTTVLVDTDRTIRTAAFTGTLQHALVEYFIADLETIRTDGIPWRLFRGRVQSWAADPHLTMTLTIEDELTARLTSSDALDRQTPIRPLDETVHDDHPIASLFQKPAPEAYGLVSDEDPGDPSVAAGTWECPYIANIDPGDLAMFLVCAQPVSFVQDVFVGDITQDPPVDRVRAPASAYGSWLFVAGHPGWPLINPWYETATGRWTVIFGLHGHPAIDLAVQGRIPLAVNFCAYEDVGDTTGLVLDSPPRAFLHWFSNRLLQDVTGNWAPLFLLGDYSLFDWNAWEVVHGLCEARGYRVAGILGSDFEPVSWRERVAEWCLNFGFDIGPNRQGQVILAMLDRTQSYAEAVRYTPAQILDRGCEVQMRADAVENIVRYACMQNYLTPLPEENPSPGERGLRDPFVAEWLSGILLLEDEASITALGGRPRGERRSVVQAYSLVRDLDTADQVAAERLALHALPNGRAEVSFDLGFRDGWLLELGDVLWLEHWDVPWTGARRCQVRALVTDLDDLRITVTVRDVDDLCLPVS